MGKEVSAGKAELLVSSEATAPASRSRDAAAVSTTCIRGYLVLRLPLRAPRAFARLNRTAAWSRVTSSGLRGLKIQGSAPGRSGPGRSRRIAWAPRGAISTTAAQSSGSVFEGPSQTLAAAGLSLYDRHVPRSQSTHLFSARFHRLTHADADTGLDRPPPSSASGGRAPELGWVSVSAQPMTSNRTKTERKPPNRRSTT
jgi:hypothetical protein